MTGKAKNSYILESLKQVYFGYGVKNRRIGAAAIINTRHPPKTKRRKTRRKSTKRGEREPFIWRPTDAVNSTVLKHPLTHSPTPKKKTKKATITLKRGLEPAQLACYCCKQHFINRTAAQQRMWYCCKTVPLLLLLLLLKYVQNRTILESHK